MYLREAFILFAITCVALALPDNLNKAASEEPSEIISLFNFMSRSASIMQLNPSRSLSCSDYYVSQINCIIREYEDNNKACAATAESARADVEAQSEETQVELGQTAESSCEEVLKCKNANSAQLKLQCYVDEGLSSSKALRPLSNTATLESSKLNEALRRIDSQETSCTTENRLKYEQDSTAAYEEFTDCIYGSIPVPKSGVICE